MCDRSASGVIYVSFNTFKVLTFDLVRSQWTAVSSHLELEDENKNMVRIYG
ncbi:hypothetical protein [Nostoc sp. CALU 546]|uniref:hypothetical protein n=1 Tax=Nostoc sp. CALU 546 TaxID=1867241 RepID=UPI003B674F31